jgi:hypothetical protein
MLAVVPRSLLNELLRSPMLPSSVVERLTPHYAPRRPRPNLPILTREATKKGVRIGPKPREGSRLLFLRRSRVTASRYPGAYTLSGFRS